MAELLSDLSYGKGVQSNIRLLEKAARLILDAKTHNENLRKLSKRMWKDLTSFRGGATDKYLTGEEKHILVTTQGISRHLVNLANNVEYVLHLVKTTAWSIDVKQKIVDCERQTSWLIYMIEGLFRLESQLDEAMKRAWK